MRRVPNQRSEHGGQDDFSVRAVLGVVVFVMVCIMFQSTLISFFHNQVDNIYAAIAQDDSQCIFCNGKASDSPAVLAANKLPQASSCTGAQPAPPAPSGKVKTAAAEAPTSCTAAKSFCLKQVTISPPGRICAKRGWPRSNDEADAAKPTVKSK